MKRFLVVELKCSLRQLFFAAFIAAITTIVISFIRPKISDFGLVRYALFYWAGYTIAYKITDMVEIWYWAKRKKSSFSDMWEAKRFFHMLDPGNKASLKRMTPAEFLRWLNFERDADQDRAYRRAVQSNLDLYRRRNRT